MSETRAACCMLWVTMMMVYFSFSSSISSSIFRVEIGSRADAGSSMSITSGLTAMVLAMQSLCCCPPESSMAFALRRSFTSSQRATLLSEDSTISSASLLPILPPSL